MPLQQAAVEAAAEEPASPAAAQHAAALAAAAALLRRHRHRAWTAWSPPQPPTAASPPAAPPAAPHRARAAMCAASTAAPQTGTAQPERTPRRLEACWWVSPGWREEVERRGRRGRSGLRRAPSRGVGQRQQRPGRPERRQGGGGRLPAESPLVVAPVCGRKGREVSDGVDAQRSRKKRTAAPRTALASFSRRPAAAAGQAIEQRHL